eukprot:5839140-Pyramimonas_sp.AAC.1
MCIRDRSLSSNASNRYLFQYNRLSIRPERLSIRPKRLSIRPERLSIRPERLSIRPKRLSIRPKRLSIRPKRLSIGPKRLSIGPEQLNGLSGSHLRTGDPNWLCNLGNFSGSTRRPRSAPPQLAASPPPRTPAGNDRPLRETIDR